MEALGKNPIHPFHRRELAETYLRLGMTTSALSEFQKAASCLEQGYEHAYLLFKTAHLMVDEIGDIPSALPTLRRIVRLYPKSYFAAYARRIINHHEAHQKAGPGRREQSAIGD
jgi:tetratricopeptide (TPR) repeat protein